MNRSSLNRLSLLTGIIFVILYLVPGFLMGQIGFMPEADTVIAFVSNNASMVYLGGYLGTLSVFFLLWFAGSLRGVLRDAGQNRDPLADIAFGGGVAVSVFVATAYSSLGVLSERAGTAAGIGPDAATVMIDLTGALNGVAIPVAFAAFSGATGLALLRTKLLPSWFGWVTVVLAIVLLTPVSYILLTLGLLWLIVLSVWLFARAGREAASGESELEESAAS